MDENALRAAGIDYDAALARFMGKQAIYEKYLRKLPEDAHMDAAWTALEQQDDAEDVWQQLRHLLCTHTKHHLGHLFKRFAAECDDRRN